MTRENKLALVVGFALILLVGVLISDHFSVARTLHAAELTQAVDPLDDPRHDNPDLIALRAGPMAADRGAESAATPPPPPPADDPLTSDSGVRAVDPTASDTADEAGLRVPAGAIDATAPRRHRIRSGESLTSICTRYYGKPNLYHRLARHNGLDDANAIRPGQRLEIPPLEVLVPAGPAPEVPAPAPPAAETPAAPATYTVREGDSLSRIAQRLLGSQQKWPALYEANRDQLDTPNDLRPGMTLKVPG
jgi:nucleoid-associated protein YgaU